MGNVYVRTALAGLLLSLVASGSALAAPTISSFSPTTGTIGTHVTINGSGFTGATAVTFAGVAATFTVNSDIKITATAPNAVATGPIKVTAGSTATSTTFTVTPGMALSTAVGPPTTVPSLYGAGFHAYNAVDLYFDNTDVALFSASSTGTISTSYQIPTSAQPGQHWITFVERGSFWSVQKPFTVQTNWVEQGFGPRGSGVNPFENTINSGNVSTLTTAWSGPAGGFAVVSPFVVAGGSVFVGDATGTIHAYSKTGALLWTASLSTDLHNVHPVAALGRVFFGDANGFVASYSQTCRSDGGVCSSQWTTSITVPVTAGLTFYKGTLYVPSADGSVHTLDPITGAAGTPIYAADTTHGAVTTPVAFDLDGSLYYGASTNLEFRYFTGNVGVSTFSGLLGPVTISGGSAYFETAEGMLHRFGVNSWDVPTSGSGAGCMSAPVVALGHVYAGGCSTLGAYSPKTGAVQWSLPTGMVKGVTEANGVLYVCEGLALEAYDSIYATNLWTGGWCNSAPEVVNGNLFAAYANVTAYDFNPSFGAVHPPPSVASLRQNYSLKPQLSGTAVVSSPVTVSEE